MKLHNFKLRPSVLILAILLSSVAFVSCGSYQSVYNDDGIYSDRKPQVVVVKTEETRKAIDENYFSNELDRIKQVNDNEIFTNVDDYSSSTDYDETDDTVPNTLINYSNSPWGYDDSANDVVVNINLDFNRWSYWDHFYGYPNLWNRRWGFRYGFYGNYVYQPYFYGYGFDPFFYYPPFYYPFNTYNYNYGYGYNRRNTTYTKRDSYYTSTSRRNTTVNSRRTYDAVRHTNATTSRRVNSTLSNFKISTRRSINNSNSNRNTTNTTRSNTNTTRRSAGTIKNTPVNRGSSNNTRTNTSTRRTSSNTNAGRTTSGSRSRSGGTTTTTTSRRKNG